jgi:hypothetical protein
MGLEVPAGADYVVEIHYAPGSLGLTDSTKINMNVAKISCCFLGLIVLSETKMNTRTALVQM